MRNKGAILFLTIVLALVCLYQLSFTFKGMSLRNQAKEFAIVATNKLVTEEQNKLVYDSIVTEKEQYFLDSISSEKVYLKLFNYRDVAENELNFGLDLKGGMDLVLEISVTDVIRNLSISPEDSLLNRALLEAKRMEEQGGGADFVALFGKAFEKVAPGVSLESYFRSKELLNEIPFGASNEEVLKVIDKEAQGAIDNAFNIIRTRIDQFGVTQPNIQRLEGTGRIMVSLPGVKDKDRVRRLLKGTANLEFWTTYENKDLQNELMNANNIVKSYLATEKALMQKKDTTASVSPALGAPTAQVVDSGKKSELNALAQQEIATTDTSLVGKGDDQYPLFKVLYPRLDQQTGQPYPGSIVGTAHFKDTAVVDKYISLAVAKNIFPRDCRFLWSAKSITGEDKKPTNYFELYAVKAARGGKPSLAGEVITTARQDFDQQNGTAYVSMDMNTEGATEWARLTRENLQKCIAIVMDDKVYSAPVVQNEIKGGSSQITGNFTIDEAKDLANLLKSGKLPAPAHIIEEAVVGPTLGQEAIDAGKLSFIIAFLVVLLYMWFYYSNSGLVADIALTVNVFFIFGVLASLGAALTLPGLAGIVLTLGMAVDANVIIYERIREELRAGKGLRLALSDGYKHAYSAIIDGNLTTILTGIILYIFGTGPIQGFATTLIIGILTSMFTAIFVSRMIFELMLKHQRDIKFSIPSTANVLVNAKVDFIGIRKILYVASIIVVGAGIVSMFTGGFKLGIDFKGGYSYVVRFDQKTQINTVDLSSAISKSLGQSAEVKTFGTEAQKQVRITTKALTDLNPSVNIDSLVESKIYAGVLPQLGENVPFEKFASDYVMSSQKVGPTISDDIKTSAIQAVIFALIGIFLYIFIRFKDWRFGLGGVISLAHDTLFVLGIYSLLRNVMPFNMEIDQSFIAAILTVIGYSINDTVIIYDRIREYRGLYPKRDQREVFNQAMNSTLGRTLNTSLTTLFTLIVMFIFGGEVIRGFIFALLIGISIGTYSSIFNAAPIVFDTLKMGRKKQNA